jgi:hypothetical protein
MTTQHPTSGGRSVGTVRSRTRVTEFVIRVMKLEENEITDNYLQNTLILKGLLDVFVLIGSICN